ncbi:MAG: hypothetical protein OIF32_09330 [Campylobacterales bacterium]|nr:hypothetical protein [Campylobacterales bacterium]
MTVSRSYSSVSKVFVKGTIDTVKNSDKIITEVIKANEENSGKQIQLIIEDSYIVLSRLIGNLLKLIKTDKLDIKLYIGEDNLITLLTKLGLKEVFQLEKIKD